MAQVTPSKPINRYQKITDSLKNGYSITKLAIPSYHRAEDVVVYEVDVSNKKLRWNLWLRYESFYLLHQMMLELVAELSTPENPIFLPPFPEKRLKLLVDHFDEEFIEQRKMLLENYLQKILGNVCLKHSEIFISFLTPPENEEFEVTATVPTGNAIRNGTTTPNEENSNEEQQQQPPSQPHEQAQPTEVLEEDDEKEKATTDDLDEMENSIMYEQRRDEVFKTSSARDLGEDDEVTGVSIPQAQVLKNDHTIYQIHVENVNKRSSFSSWTVLKRYGEFFAFDHNLRQALVHENPDDMRCIPRLPPKQVKVIVDHLDQTFIERRRLLLQCYLQRLIRYPVLRRHDITLDFLGVS